MLRTVVAASLPNELWSKNGENHHTGQSVWFQPGSGGAGGGGTAGVVVCLLEGGMTALGIW